MKIFYFFYSIMLLFTKKYVLKVVNIIDEDPYTKTIQFEIPKKFKWAVGQNALVAFPKAFHKFIIQMNYVRYMAIARSNDQKYLEITSRVPGSNSLYKKMLSKIQVGDHMYMFSVGIHSPLIRKRKHIVFLSMGIGNVTFKNLFENYEADKENILSVVSINVDRHQTNLYENLYPNVQKYYCKDRSSYLNTLNQYIDQANSMFYLVGSDEYVKEQIKILKGHGINDHEIIIDRPNYHRVKQFGLKKLTKIDLNRG